MRVGVMIGSRFKDRVPERQPFGDSTVAKMGMGHGEESSVAAEGGAEPRGRAKRRRSRQLQGWDVEASGEVGGQSEAGIVPSADGVDAGTGEG